MTPNLLSIFRMTAFVPVIILFLFEYYLSSFFLFSAAAWSDFLDGFLARKYNLTSNLGSLLDLLADKVLVSSILIFLIFFTSNFYLSFLTLIIILREIIVSGLRDFFLHSTKTLLVTNLAKWKTLIQMSSLGFLIVQNNFETKFILYFGNVGLTFASIVTIYTGYIYFKKNLKLF